ncbi:class I SAM-dependent methyltransferase [Antarcticibacterium flavum]|uniref:class I SAM-dependent methyltransferase n=1 Tax=Antarcticibacterium flavum TaxID=2058175 RepID=UPI00143D476B|nr:class I SAM-dependent methyltransferase [Antarcticibacterium flavum]
MKTLHRLSLNSRFPAGHFYSSVVSLDDIRKRQDQIWPSDLPQIIPGIDLRRKEQLELLSELSKFYIDLPFPENKNKEFRYFLNNPYFSYGDGLILYFMIRHYEPKKIIEIGSGFSSALMLDTNECFFGGEIELIFVEPYPETRLLQLMNKKEEKVQLIAEEIQGIPLHIFKTFEPGDILFVDSSHIIKTGSDVQFILNKILPILKKGVLIHIHDIHFPFEYPKDWVLDGFGWNEVYYIQAFLMYNEGFKIIMFNDYLSKVNPEALVSMPLMAKATGSSLWLEKTI